MKELPLVSIICSCYNQKKYVIDSLKSVINQTYENIELIIVDDCSTDTSAQEISKWLIDYPLIRFVRNPDNLGITKSFNNTVKLTNGEYLIDFAADDILKPNCVERLVSVFLDREDDDLSLVFGNASEIDKNGKFISLFLDKKWSKKIKAAINDDFYYHLLSSTKYMCSVSAMYSKKIFHEIGGYDEDLFFEDLDYWFRVTNKYSIAFIDDIVIEKRFLEKSLGKGFYENTEYTKKLHISFYHILFKTYKLNTNLNEYHALLKRILKQSRWAIKTMNLKYICLYILLLVKVLFRILLKSF